MSGVADFGAQSWAGLMFGVGAVPATFYLALCTDEPGSGWDGTVLATVEPQGSTTYARQSIATPAGWTLSDGNYVINATTLTFPVPDVDWGQITVWALTDALTAGNLWAWGSFAEGTYIAAGYALSVPIGSLLIGLSNQLASIAT